MAHVSHHADHRKNHASDFDKLERELHGCVRAGWHCASQVQESAGYHGRGQIRNGQFLGVPGGFGRDEVAVAGGERQPQAAHDACDAHDGAHQRCIGPAAQRDVDHLQRAGQAEHDQLDGNARKRQQVLNRPQGMFGSCQVLDRKQAAHHAKDKRYHRREKRDLNRFAQQIRHARKGERATAATGEHRKQDQGPLNLGRHDYTSSFQLAYLGERM